MNSFKDMKGCFSDKKALIIGNGPSLDNIDFDLLKGDDNIVTFSTNQIADICKKNIWFPDFYTSFFCGPLRGRSYSFSDGTLINYNGSYEKALEAQEDIK